MYLQKVKQHALRDADYQPLLIRKVYERVWPLEQGRGGHLAENPAHCRKQWAVSEFPSTQSIGFPWTHAPLVCFRKMIWAHSVSSFSWKIFKNFNCDTNA